MVQNGTRADIARKRFEDTNQLTAENMIYIGTGDKEDLGSDVEADKRYIYKTKGKNIISAINDAGIINKAHSAETADQATNANTAKEIVSEDDSSITIIKGKSDNNQSRIVPPEGVEVDLGASGCEFAKVYANTFTGTANAAIDTNFSRETFKSSVISDTSFGLPEAGFYYIYFVINSLNINLGLIYWDGNNTSYGPITAVYSGTYGSFDILCDEYLMQIGIRGRFNIWKKERIKYYNEQIKKDPAHKEQYIDKFWEEYQRLNPHKYRKDRAKDQRLEDFKKLQDLVEKEKYKLRKLEVKQEKIEKELSDKEIALNDMNKKIAEAGSMMVTTDRLKQLEKENQDKINKKIKEQEMTQKRLDSETKKMNKTISDTKTQIKIIAELETKLQNEEISRQQAIEELRKGDLEDIIKNFKLKSTPKINELIKGIDKNNFNTDEDDNLDGI